MLFVVFFSRLTILRIVLREVFCRENRAPIHTHVERNVIRIEAIFWKISLCLTIDEQCSSLQPEVLYTNINYDYFVQ